MPVTVPAETVQRQSTTPLWMDFGPSTGGSGFLHELSHELPDYLDRSVHAAVAKATGGVSPLSIAGSFLDWGAHFWFSPGKQMHIAFKGWDKLRRLTSYSFRLAGDLENEPCIEPLVQDRRFRAESWKSFPFNLIHQQFLLTQQFWHNVFTGVPGVQPKHEALADFTARQFLDTVAPSNFFFTNPEVLERTIEERGANLARGAAYFVDDMLRRYSGRPPAGHEAYKVGRDLAATPGKVVFRNRLIELIQYTPTTSEVKAPPVLILPAWIMKYYILDLSETNSLVRYLVDAGHTVFIVSWRNPTAEDRDLSFEDYLDLGAFAAVDAVKVAVPDEQVHLVGYCLGGTSAAIAAATMARDGNDAIRSLTMLAAQVDFSQAGELALFISDSQLAFLEDLMWDQGYLAAEQMAGAFQVLRSNDLIWSRSLRSYWLGERRPPNDLMVWNADGTRMPYRMHSEYLRKLYLNNDLAHGRFEVHGRPVSIGDINVPVFAVGTTRDHVAPWKSVYKLHLLSDTDLTFVLTDGGHNGGIISEPGHPGRSFKSAFTASDAAYRSPEQWLEEAKDHPGSWWPKWEAWLSSFTDRTEPARTPHLIDVPANELAACVDAPGTYVFQK
ncbi:poly-beta-hydroxybutyrate polymerase [Parvularcula lutaonensis]|nr:poly-beta-hydroxybutyrate polymerase [Parvularcula lutaonensis]